MPSSEEIIYERVYPEFQTAILESGKHLNKVYTIVLSLKRGTPNVDIKVHYTKTLPLTNIFNGIEEYPKMVLREEDMVEAKKKLKLDIEKLVNDHGEGRGKTSITLNIKEGAYTSAEWNATEDRYEPNKSFNSTSDRKKRLTFEAR